jgi:hypothetical protein
MPVRHGACTARNPAQKCAAFVVTKHCSKRIFAGRRYATMLANSRANFMGESRTTEKRDRRLQTAQFRPSAKSAKSE